MLPVLGWLGAAVFATVGAYGIARLAAACAHLRYTGRHRAVDVAHVVMGFGMAVMVSPVGGPLPMAAWQTVFVLVAAWFLGAWAHDRRRPEPPIGWHGSSPHHALGAIAMLYMLAAVPHPPSASASAWMPAHTGQAAVPALGWLLVALLVAGAVPLVRALRGPGSPDLLLCRRRAACAQLAMTAGMAAMLASLL